MRSGLNSTRIAAVSLLLGISGAAVGGGEAAAQMTVSEEPVPAFERALATATALAGGELMPSGIAFESQVAGGEDPGTELMNGTIVDATFFPAVLRATSTAGACTASLIGSATVLLAAHCFSSDVALVTFKLSGQSLRGLCEAAPGFADHRSDDWALCILERSVSQISFEAVNLKAVPVAGTRIMLTGYGCTMQGEAPAIRPLRAGISRTKSGAASGVDRSYIFTKSDPDAGQAILCPGDSGGPAFVVLGNTNSDSRMIVGVNSRTRIELGLGFVAATASSAGAAFIKDWVSRNDQNICGFNPASGQRCMWSE